MVRFRVVETYPPAFKSWLGPCVHIFLDLIIYYSFSGRLRYECTYGDECLPVQLNYLNMLHRDRLYVHESIWVSVRLCIWRYECTYADRCLHVQLNYLNMLHRGRLYVHGSVWVSVRLCECLHLYRVSQEERLKFHTRKHKHSPTLRIRHSLTGF